MPVCQKTENYMYVEQDDRHRQRLERCVVQSRGGGLTTSATREELCMKSDEHQRGANQLPLLSLGRASSSCGDVESALDLLPTGLITSSSGSTPALRRGSAPVQGPRYYAGGES